MTYNAKFFDALTEHVLFSGLPLSLLQAVLPKQQVSFLRFKRGETLLPVVQDGPAIGFLLRGEARLQGANGETPLETLLPGDVFGCEALFLSGGEQVGTVVATKAGEAALLSKSAVTQLLEREPLFALRLIRYLSQRVVTFSGKIGLYTGGSAEEKLAQYLFSGFGDYKTCELELSMSQLALLLQIGRASLYRAFDSLEEKGAIARDGKNIRLVSRDVLLSCCSRSSTVFQKRFPIERTDEQ